MLQGTMSALRAFCGPSRAYDAMARRVGLPAQCEGVARSGRRCTITSDSKLRDGDGRLVAAPLQVGGRYCGFHASVFCSRHVHPEGHLLSCFLGFETTGSSLSCLSQLGYGLASRQAQKRIAEHQHATTTISFTHCWPLNHQETFGTRRAITQPRTRTKRLPLICRHRNFDGMQLTCSRRTRQHLRSGIEKQH